VSMAFFVALMEIIGINIILSGDNAIVIALACRSLPARQRKAGIFFGAAAAVALRIVFTVFVAWVMAVPFLKIAGGLLLLWIGYKLMIEPETDEADIHAASHLFGVIRTIMIADAVMSLDNVLAVAAAAKGSHVLLILGLVISIPLVVYGATLMMALIQRFPFVVTLGAGLIGYVGGEVIVSDPSIEPWLQSHAPWSHFAFPLICAVLVVDCGRLLAPAHVAKPRGVMDLTAAPAAMAGLRLVGMAFGALVLGRAPLILSFFVGLFGYVGTESLLESSGDLGEIDFVRVVGPIAGTMIALAAAEVAGRIMRLHSRGKA
jgi:YjbE family integral membrane protein